MAVHRAMLRFRTRGHGHIVDLTQGVASAVEAAGAQQGIVCVAGRGSTVAVTTMEYEPGGVHDLTEALERLIPTHGDYQHNRLNHDTNSHAHMRAAIVGPTETIPIDEGRLALGTWQQVLLLDYRDRERDRSVNVQVVW